MDMIASWPSSIASSSLFDCSVWVELSDSSLFRLVLEDGLAPKKDWRLSESRSLVTMRVVVVVVVDVIQTVGTRVPVTVVRLEGELVASPALETLLGEVVFFTACKAVPLIRLGPAKVLVLETVVVSAVIEGEMDVKRVPVIVVKLCV